MANPASTNNTQSGHAASNPTSSSDDLEVASQSRAQDNNKAVIRVVDAPLDGRKPELRAVFSLTDDILEGLKGLPTHNTDTARILDVTSNSDFGIPSDSVVLRLRQTKGIDTRDVGSVNDAVNTFLQQEYTRKKFVWPQGGNNIMGITSQWSQRLDGDTTNLYCLVNRTSLQQHPMDYDVHPKDSYLACAQDAEGRLIVTIIHDAWPRQTCRMKYSHDNVEFQNPRSVTKILEQESWIALADGSIDTFAKLVVLDFILTSIYLQPVDYYAELFYKDFVSKKIKRSSITNNPHLQVPLGLFEPGLSAKSKEAIKEIEGAEGILSRVNNSVDSILFVISALKKNLTGVPQPDPHRRSLEELKEFCLERQSNVKRTLEYLNRKLEHRTNEYTIREARSIKILTILAVLYLPLSLSATLLGMQSPFKKIALNAISDETIEAQDLVGTNLLFDFLGIFVVLATATMLILNIIRLTLWFKGYKDRVFSKEYKGELYMFFHGPKWRHVGFASQMHDFTYLALRWWVIFGFMGIIAISFIVGMLGSGWIANTVLMYIIEGYLCTVVVLVMLNLIASFVLYLVRTGRIRDGTTRAE